MCGGGGDKGNKKANIEGGPTTGVSSLDIPYSQAPQVVKDMITAIAMGPQGYSDAMRRNLHIDQSIAGQDANGVRPVSQMTKKESMPFNYTPNTPTPDTAGAGGAAGSNTVAQASQADRDLAAAGLGAGAAPAAAAGGGGGSAHYKIPMTGWNFSPGAAAAVWPQIAEQYRR